MVVTTLALLAIGAAASGGECAGCTIFVGLLERLSLRFHVPLNQTVVNFCADLSPEWKKGQEVCDYLLKTLIPLVEVDFALKLSPDHTCHHTIDLCKEFPTCTLYTKWPLPSETQHETRYQPQTPASEGKLSGIPPAVRDFFFLVSMGIGAQDHARMSKVIQSFRQKVDARDIPVADHLPLVDLDNDTFGPEDRLRGAHWRGKDCDDLNADIHPGRKINNHGPRRDHNCNGISGVAPDGSAFEDKFCNSTGYLGLIALGDSVTAHFRIPPTWLDAMSIDNSTYSNVIPLAEDEFDWPLCSSGTGFINDTQKALCPPSQLPLGSIYQRLRARNRCNHRDFQNVGVNGARTSSMRPGGGIIDTVKSRAGTGQPALVVYALVGNDVCSGHHDYDHMTTPAEFEANVLAALNYLDQHLEKGSYVALSGLVDGRVLYDTMHAEIHPVGVNYTNVYNYLNCLEISPCWGWMNENATVRNFTSQRARDLNAVYPKIIQEHTFSSFKAVYINTYDLLNQIVKDWIASGKKARDLIEPTDGFHPSQTANSLLADTLWKQLSTNLPEAIGKENPYNAAIDALFGDQGGH